MSKIFRILRVFLATSPVFRVRPQRLARKARQRGGLRRHAAGVPGRPGRSTSAPATTRERKPWWAFISRVSRAYDVSSTYAKHSEPLTRVVRAFKRRAVEKSATAIKSPSAMDFGITVPRRPFTVDSECK